MKFDEIAKFLNISKRTAMSLGERRVLPGQPSAEGWDASLKEIDLWYVKLSGKQWADLVADGQIDPLAVEVDLEGETTADALLNTLRSWEKKEIVKIISHKLDRTGNPEAVLMLREAIQEGTRGLESLGRVAIEESLCSQTKVGYRCLKALGENPVLIRVSTRRNLKLSVKDPLAEMPQREREVVSFYLGQYALRLATELRAKCGRKA